MAGSKSKSQPTWTGVKAKLAHLDRRVVGEIFDRWLWSDVYQSASVASAKQAISSYRKAVGEPAGLAELIVFYCERAAGFCNGVGYEDESYFNALVRMFEQAVTLTNQLPASQGSALLARLDRIRAIGHNLGWGVGDDMDSLLGKYASL